MFKLLYSLIKEGRANLQDQHTFNQEHSP